MSMRTISTHITICEVCRLINDLCQSDSEKDAQIRELCVVGLIVGKRVSLKVPKEDLLKIADLGPYHKTYDESLKKRVALGFKHDWSKVDEIKKKYGILEV
jgi:hypothetical protein